MDEENRENAQLEIINAIKLKRIGASSTRIIEAYEQAIQLLLAIANKNTNDFMKVANIYHQIGTQYFNQKQYLLAGQSYTNSITQLHNADLNDNTYRKLTERYIDLADTCIELSNRAAADEAMNNALKAFACIKEKTDDELLISDTSTNFAAFYTHFQEILSADSYKNSPSVKNHARLFGATQESKQLLDQLNSLSVADVDQIYNDLPNMLTHLSLSSSQAQSLFNPVLINQAPNDKDYRALAKQFLELAQSHLKNGLIPDLTAAITQAISALQHINPPTEHDVQMIKHLQERSVSLQTKPNGSGNQSLATQGTFFAPPAAVNSDAMADSDDEMLSTP